MTPFTGGFTPPLNVSGVPDFEGRLSGNLISDGWFTTFGTTVIAGRDLTDRDVKGAARVAVIDRAFAGSFSQARARLDTRSACTLVAPEPCRLWR